MENSGAEELKSTETGNLNENEKRQIVEEMLNELGRSKNNLDEYLEKQRGNKNGLDMEMDSNARGETERRLADLVRRKIEDGSDLSLLTVEAKKMVESDELERLRRIIQDPSIKETDKVAHLEEAEGWYRMTGNTLDQIYDSLPKVKSSLGNIIEDSLTRDTPHDEYVRMRAIEEATGNYVDKGMRSTRDIQEELMNSRRLWSMKLEMLMS